MHQASGLRWLPLPDQADYSKDLESRPIHGAAEDAARQRGRDWG